MTKTAVDVLEKSVKLKNFKLKQPIYFGEKAVDQVQIIPLTVSALRGISLVKLGEMDADVICKLIPRCTMPSLTAHQVANLAFVDFMGLANEIISTIIPQDDSEGKNLA